MGLVLPLDRHGRLLALHRRVAATHGHGGERDVTATLHDALQVAGLSEKQRPRLLSDNGPCYVSSALHDWLQERSIGHTRGKPYHPMTQGKIERWHRSLKNGVPLEHYDLPDDLKRAGQTFGDPYNIRRYHESLNNLIPEDVWSGRAQAILDHRRKIKDNTPPLRKQLHQQKIAA